MATIDENLRRVPPQSLEAEESVLGAVMLDDTVLDHAEQLIFGIQERKVKQAFAKLSEVLVESIKTIERLYEQKQAVTGVPTGFADLDALTAGLQPSDLIVVAGRPSMGKCLA